MALRKAARMPSCGRGQAGGRRRPRAWKRRQRCGGDIRKQTYLDRGQISGGPVPIADFIRDPNWTGHVWAAPFVCESNLSRPKFSVWADFASGPIMGGPIWTRIF